MSNIISAPETGTLSGAYAPGVLESYNATELDQIDKVQVAGKTIDEAQHGFQCEVIRLKQLLDGQDQAEGITPGNGRPSSRFWEGARAGHFGEKLRGYADNGDRKTIQRWVTANEAASILLESSVARATQLLPFELARERGMGQTALCTYMRLFPEAREMATHYFTVTGELRSDMLQEFEQVIREFPDRTEFVLNAITNRTLTVPSEFKAQKETWRTELAAEKARIQDREHQARLAEAEAQEEELENYKPKPSNEKHVGDQPDVEDVTRRIAPSRKWFETDSGIMKVKQVVGDLPEPLPELLTGLNGLNKALIDQAEQSGVMHNYAEFWAGYDRFAMSPSAAKRTWGQSGRLERMRKLRAKLIEVQQRIDMYIQSTTPPENIEYPED
jgi:hypothetical protein